MSARHSRIGVNLTGPSLGSESRIGAKLEADFAGGFPHSGTAARQPQLRLRHAWVEIACPVWSIRFGQDWALISGPFPKTASFVVGAGKGNLWMRLPQISGRIDAGMFSFAASLNRPVAGNIKYDAFAAGDLDVVGDGERSGLPWAMARVWVKGKGMTLSASVHYGKEQVNDLSGISHDKKSYSANADLQVVMGPAALTVRAFTGENLNTFLGGVIQGITSDSSSVTNIKSSGGWAQVVVKLNKQWTFTAGGGLDDPDDTTLLPGMRARNDWVFSNIAYTLRQNLTFMLEASCLQTAYIDDKSGKNLRWCFVTQLNF